MVHVKYAADYKNREYLLFKAIMLYSFANNVISMIMEKKIAYSSFLNTSVPVVVMDSYNHHCVGIARSLGRLGVTVYGIGPSRLAAGLHSRYFRKKFVWDTAGKTPEANMRCLLQIGTILRKQVQLLEQISGKKVVSIARHSPWDRDPFAAIKGFINANHPLMRGDLYVHDSCRAWTPIKGLLRLLHNPPRKVQLLIHCDNWTDTKIDRKTLLKKLLKNSAKSPILFGERLEKYWLEDSPIIEYDHAVKSGLFSEYYDTPNTLSRKFMVNPKSFLLRDFEYYSSLIRWYLINTSIGWQFYRRISKMRSRSTFSKE